MRARWLKFAGVSIAVAAGVLALGQATTQAQSQAATVPMQVTENRVPGATGQVTMTPQGNNQLRVQIRITGLQANAEHAAHIHGGGQCDTNAAVTHPLNSVRVDASGVGTSDTTVTAAADNPLRPQSYVNVHQGNTPPGNGVICANVPANFSLGAGTGGAGTAAQPGAAPAAPRTGVGTATDGAGRPAWLLAGLAAIAVFGGGLAFARGRAR